MIGMAHQRGGDAVSISVDELVAGRCADSRSKIIAFRFDSTSETGMSEVCAYGTAVKFKRRQDVVA
jgi:hypothetical protein